MLPMRSCVCQGRWFAGVGPGQSAPMPDSGPLAGEPRERSYHPAPAARAGAWLIWWVLLMSFWVMLDDSVATDELLAGAGAAAIAAVVAEVAGYQAATRF